MTKEQIYAELDALKTRSETENRPLVTVVSFPYKALANAYTIGVLTEWDEFCNLDWNQLIQDMLKPAFVFDPRNVLDAKELVAIGFHLSSVGELNLATKRSFYLKAWHRLRFSSLKETL